MQKDFHYDIIYALTKEAVYKDSEASIITHVSHYKKTKLKKKNGDADIIIELKNV